MKDAITVLGEEFSRQNIPHVARMWDIDRVSAESRIQSVANAWHNGSIVGAVQALESDLSML